MTGCVVCGYAEPRSPFRRDGREGAWEVSPCGGRCRRRLEAEAKLIGKSINFFWIGRFSEAG